MATVAWVRAVRGMENYVGEEHGDLLRGAMDCFESCRVKRPQRDPTAGTRAFLLPGKGTVRDWFLPRMVVPVDGRFAWQPSGDDQRRALYAHVATFCKLGIPSSLLEPHDNGCMKLFVPMEACVKRDALPHAGADEVARAAFWSDLKHRFTMFATSIMAEAVSQIFAAKEDAPSVLIAIFDASGYSPAIDRWMLSFRVCFVEIAVTSSVAMEMRDLCISRLDAAWARQLQQPGQDRSWASTVEPLQRPANSGSQHSFWASALHGPLKVGAYEPLVFCDTVLGEDDCLLPEHRPLLPYGLFERPADSVTAELKAMPLAERLEDYDWVSIGSVCTHLKRPSDRRHDAHPPRYMPLKGHGPKVHAPRQAPSSPARARHCASERRGAAAQGVSVGQGWFRYWTIDGKPYYHNPDKRRAVWDLPFQGAAPPQPASPEEVAPDLEWVEYRDDSGRRYYHNEISRRTEWEPPPGARVRTAAL